MSVRPPPPEILFPLHGSIAEFVTRVLWAWQLFPDWRATSWWRDPVRNRRVGGHPDSQHLIGTAVDLIGPEHQADDFEAALIHRGLVVDRDPSRSTSTAWSSAAGELHVQAWPASVRAVARLRDTLHITV